MLDMGFFTTSVTAIVMAGKDNQENPELKAMLDSITFK
jgi:hypothetical protein